MRNHRFDADAAVNHTIRASDLPAGSDTLPSGHPVVLTTGNTRGRIGIATCSGKVGEVIAVKLHGVYELAKPVGAVDQHADLYWNPADENATTVNTAAVGPLRAWYGAAAGDSTIYVNIRP